MVEVFPTFEVEGVKLPRILIGINPFLGYSHFSEAKDRYFKRIFSSVEAISEIIVRATELGVTGIYTPADEKIAKALVQVEQISGIKMTVVGTAYSTLDFEKIRREIELLDTMGARICLLHGNMVDHLLNHMKRTITDAEKMLKLIRDNGMVPGIACHDSYAIVYADQQGYDTQLYATPVNKIGFWMNPEGRTLRAIRETPKPIIALKPFASGRIQPQEGLEFTLTTPGVKTVAIGVASMEEVNQDFQLAKEILHEKGML